MAFSLSDNHFAQDPKDRKPKKRSHAVGCKNNLTRFERTEQLIELVYCDIINGVPKADIKQKMHQGVYNGVEYKDRYIADIYNCAMDRIALNREDRLDKKRAVMWSRYQNLYKECMESGNQQGARQCLNDMMKLFGLAQENPSTAIQINGNDGVKISFGFLNNKEEEDEDGATI